MKLKNLLCLAFGVFGALVYGVLNIAVAWPFLLASFFFAVIPFWNQTVDLEKILERMLRK